MCGVYKLEFEVILRYR